MKFLVHFDKKIGRESFTKELLGSESVDDLYVCTMIILQIHISLNYEEMEKCKILFKGKVLNDKNAQLSTLFDPLNVNDVTISYLSDIESFVKESNELT